MEVPGPDSFRTGRFGPAPERSGRGGWAVVSRGRALLSGMIVSTVLTLVLVPCVYSLVHRRSPQPA